MMDAARLIAVLELPAESRLDRRVPKKLLLEQGAPTAADKRLIQDGLEALHWIAALKPGNVALPAFRDETREYVELAVVHAELRPGAGVNRLLELIHRAIPYPLVLLVTGGEGVMISLVHKRRSQGEAGKVVLDGEGITERVASDDGVEGEFLASLALARQNAKDLHDLYRGWMARLVALTTARLTGNYVPTLSEEDDRNRREALRLHGELTKQLAGMRALAVREKQLNRRVELNLEIKRLETKLCAVRDALMVASL